MQGSVTRRAVIAGVGAVSLAGCTEDLGPWNTADGSADGSGPPTSDEQLTLPMEPSALQDEVVSGGPPKDGIPSIDEPTFESADEAQSRLDPGDPVFGLATGGDSRVYPQSILVQHEICNDVVGDTPVSVTYCPLTGTAMGFERGDTTFGVSGRLVNNNLIMYDRGTETWWPQVLATAIPGPWNDAPATRSLSEFRVVWTTWERWQGEYPDTQVLSRDTGYARNYDRDPYGSYNPRGGYYSPDAAPTFASLSDDDRLQPKTVVIGARTSDGAVAFRKDELGDANLVDGTLGGTHVVASYDPELDTGYVFENPDDLQFEYSDGAVVDASGHSYAPDALPLERILAFDAMWFAWSGFYPDTTLYA